MSEQTMNDDSKQPPYRLGLDIGTNSIGWAMLELDGNERPQPVSILRAGVRIFHQGRDDKTLSTLNENRRNKRGMRRNRDRYLQRRSSLINKLLRYGLFPQDKEARRKLQDEDPYELRAKALDEKLELGQVGRALFHLNQRRGFKSNRKSDRGDSERGVVHDSIKKLKRLLWGDTLADENYLGPRWNELPDSKNKEKILSKDQLIHLLEKAEPDDEAALGQLMDEWNLAHMNAINCLGASPNHETLGQLLHQRKESGSGGVRARRRGTTQKDLYDIYPDRRMLEQEFDLIWERQAEYHRDTMTDEARNSIREALFHQRKLKPPVVGECSLIPGEKRCPRALPSAQLFRILQELNNLNWATVSGVKWLKEYPDIWEKLVKRLNGETKKMEFEQIRKFLIKNGVPQEDTGKFNLETTARKELDGNKTAFLLRKKDCVGPARWDDWELEQQDAFIFLLEDEELSDEVLEQKLVDEWELSREQAENCMNANIPDEHANLSLKAISLLLPRMKERLRYDEAVHETPELGHHSDRRYKGELISELPYYGEILQGSTVVFRDPKKFSDQEKRKYPELLIGRITNPTVHIALGQLRKIVNELVDKFGHPRQIVVEVGRDLPLGPDGRREGLRKQRDNQDRRKKYVEQIEEKGETINGRNIEKLRLWDELGTEGALRPCVYCGENMGYSNLFDGSIEIEHILPYSTTLDNGLNNKTLSHRSCNRQKGDRTPYEAFGSDDARWASIHQISQRFNDRKRKRFNPKALEEWLNEDEDFLARQLNDMRYISKISLRYLQPVCPDILAVPGHITSLIRNKFNLRKDRALPKSPDRSPAKDRNDHRNHTVDAVAVALADRSLLQKIATERGKGTSGEEFKKEAEERLHERKEFVGILRSFEKKVFEDVIVSHRLSKKRQGSLFNETAYGMVEETEGNAPDKVVHRIPLASIDSKTMIRKIKGDLLREKLLAWLDGIEDKKGILEALARFEQKTGTRRVRIEETVSVIPIRDRAGKAYKYYKKDSNWAMEIYANPNGKWQGEVIPTFYANQKDFVPNWQKRYPTAKLVMRLYINSMLGVETEDGKEQIMRVQNISAAITLAPHNEANVDSRYRDKEDEFKYYYTSPSSLQKKQGRLLHISPAGFINQDGRCSRESEKINENV